MKALFTCIFLSLSAFMVFLIWQTNTHAHPNHTLPAITYPLKDMSQYSKDELKKNLTPLQYKVVKEDGTEPPFRNEYWDNKAEGIYVDIISGKALFSSKDKFDSGTGWPSFTQPIDGQEIKEVVDRSHGMVRTEVRSRTADAHLGHLFPDGPQPTGMRYCINSASLHFIPKEDLAKANLGQYSQLFEK